MQMLRSAEKFYCLGTSAVVLLKLGCFQAFFLLLRAGRWPIYLKNSVDKSKISGAFFVEDYYP